MLAFLLQSTNPFYWCASVFLRRSKHTLPVPGVGKYALIRHVWLCVSQVHICFASCSLKLPHTHVPLHIALGAAESEEDKKCCVRAKLLQLCLSVCGILQARILEWVAIEVLLSNCKENAFYHQFSLWVNILKEISMVSSA